MVTRGGNGCDWASIGATAQKGGAKADIGIPSPWHGRNVLLSWLCLMKMETEREGEKAAVDIDYIMVIESAELRE